MSRFWLACLVAVLGLGGVAPLSAQPVNDLCSGALEVFCGDVVFGSTDTANPESLPFCGTSDGSQGAVWYRFVGTGEEVVLNTCQPGTTYDTKIRVYTGTCGNFTCVTGNDDVSCSPSFRSEVEFFTAVGVDYWIVVHGFSGAFGDFEMTVTCLPPPAPDPNDLCVNAELITAGAVSGSTPANDSDGETSCGNSNNSPSVWYRFVATDDLTLRARTCTADFDTVVSIHSGCPGDLATELACSDNACSGTGSSAEVMATTGVEYWIRVAGANNSAGDFTLEVEMFDPTLVVGADVVYTDCRSITNWGQIGGTRAYSLGSWTCNIGDEDLLWGTNTPLLGMNGYRLSNGRLTQLGMSWMKRGTGAAAGNGCGPPCNGNGGSVLGAGCLDVYGSGFNGSQGILGPRSQVNAFTGDNPGSSGNAPDLRSKRLQISESDLLVGGLYFVEGVYVAPDDAANGNAYNNASYKRVNVNTSSFDMTPTGAMQLYRPAIEAWRDHGNGVDTPDLSVELTTADIPNEGRFHIASKVTDLGGGQYLYDYAVFNLNSHRSAGSFSIPIPPGANVSGIGFHDVDYHSGEPYDPTDWSATVDGTSITWSSPQTFAQNENTNALRFGTMYNFWFESDASPGTTDATIGIFRPGTPTEIDVTLQGPEIVIVGDLFRRGDCNDDASYDISDPVFLLSFLFPSMGGPVNLVCPDACDVNDDGALNIADAVSALDGLFGGGSLPGAPHPDCGTDPTADSLDCPSASNCP